MKYYDCALKAMWMNKYFGMEFVDEYREPCKFSVEYGTEILDKYYIHPDILHILEPQVGDLLHIVRGFCSYYKKVDDVAKGGTKNVTGIWSGGEHWDITTKEPLHDWEIIQRNGIAFIIPEVEL